MPVPVIAVGLLAGGLMHVIPEIVARITYYVLCDSASMYFIKLLVHFDGRIGRLVLYYINEVPEVPRERIVAILGFPVAS